MDDEFENDNDTEFDNPDGFPCLEECGEFIENPKYVVFFNHEPDKKFGSDILNVKVDPNMIIHRVMMRLKNLVLKSL